MKHIKLIVSLLMTCNVLNAAIYSCDLRQALVYLQEHTNDNTCVFVNIDVDGMEHLLTRDYKDTLKRAHELCQKQHSEGFELISTINDTMKVLDPVYLASAKITPNCIGFTRRSLRWSHLVRGICYDHNIKKETKRFLIVIPTDDPEYPKVIECNTGIIYLENAQTADAISNYIKKWQPDCQHIILIDTQAAALQTCMINLHQLGTPEITSLLVQK